ncbi:hypothetical protein ACVWWP_005836 [Bradyrhizobium sp. LM3.6]
MNKKLGYLSCYLALPLLMAAALTTEVRADGETIAVFTKNQTNPFFQTVRVGADNMAKTLNAKTLQYIPTKPDSIPEQLSQIEDVVVKKPSAIVFTPVDYKAMVPGVEKINEAKIPVINITDRSAGGKFVSFVGADDYSLGLETARFLLKTLGGKGNIVIIEGVKGSLTNVDRVRGFNDALKENAGAKLLASQPGNYQRLQALQVMENLMQSNAQIDGVSRRQRRHGGRRDRGARRRQPQGAGDRHQWHQGSDRRDQVRQIARERRLQRIFPRLPRHHDGDPIPAQPARHRRNRAEADRHHQGQLPAVRRAAGAAQLPDFRRSRQARRQVSVSIKTNMDGRRRGRPKNPSRKRRHHAIRHSRHRPHWRAADAARQLRRP